MRDHHRATHLGKPGRRKLVTDIRAGRGTSPARAATSSSTPATASSRTFGGRGKRRQVALPTPQHRHDTPQAVGQAGHADRVGHNARRASAHIADRQVETPRQDARPHQSRIRPDHIPSGHISTTRDVGGGQIGTGREGIPHDNLFRPDEIGVVQRGRHGNHAIGSKGLRGRNGQPDQCGRDLADLDQRVEGRRTIDPIHGIMIAEGKEGRLLIRRERATSPGNHGDGDIRARTSRKRPHMGQPVGVDRSPRHAPPRGKRIGDDDGIGGPDIRSARIGDVQRHGRALAVGNGERGSDGQASRELGNAVQQVDSRRDGLPRRDAVHACDVGVAAPLGIRLVRQICHATHGTRHRQADRLPSGQIG